MIHKYTLHRLQLFLIILFIIVLKFIFVRSLLFEGINIFHTIIVEIGYIILLLSIIELIPFQKVQNTLYITLNIILSILLFSILVYHSYFNYIATVHAFSLFGQLGGVKDSIFELINPIYFILFVDFVLLFIYTIFITKKQPTYKRKAIRPLYLILTLLIGLSLVSFQLINEKDVQIANNVLAAEKQGLFTYEILTTIKSKSNNSDTNLTTKEIHELPNQILDLKGITPLPHNKLKFNGVAKGKNIIVIQAEAFQDFAVNLEIGGQEVTPFLNELLSESIYFPNAIQQVGPGNTSDAEFIFNTSLYPAEFEPSSELYEDKSFPSLPKLLKEESYKSITFHPNDINFWNREHLYPSLGFDHYYDDTFFQNEDIIGMGSSDELVYTKAFPELKALYDDGQPFYAQFVTLTSHHPFKIPEDKDNLDLPSEFDGTILKDYLKSLTYTDWALKQFVDDLKEANMWEDTILVFYGDHMGMQAKKRTAKEIKLLSMFIGHEYKRIDQFNIPFIITLPGENISEKFETVGGQLDFMPTIANLLDLSLRNHIHFGQDIINYPDNLFGMRYYMPPGSFYYQDTAFIPAEGFDDGEAFNWKTGETISDFSAYKKYYDRMLKILKLSDDYINNLPNKSNS